MSNRQIEKQIKDAVKVIGSTLGPNGKLVSITTVNPNTQKAETILTKDGYKVSQSLKDQSAGANFVRQVCKRQVREVGDGCQPLWEKILTPTGYITFAEVKEGDIIVGSNGLPQKVLKVYDKGEKELLRLTFSHGESVVCSPDHMWTLKNRKTGEYENKKVEEIYDNIKDCHDRFIWSLPEKPVVQFNERKVILDPFFLGAYLGDGNVLFNDNKPNSPRICFTLGNKKQSVLERIKQLHPEDDISIYYETKSFVRVRIGKDSGRTIYSELAKLDLLGKAAKDKFIPEEYLFNSVSVREELFNGLIATDGNINERGRIGYTTSSLRLAEDIKLLAQSLGYGVWINKRVRTESRNKFKKGEYVCYDLCFYKDVSKLVKIEHLGYKEPVRCIKVSNADELYLTSNCLLTHNTTSVAILLAHLIDYDLKDLLLLQSLEGELERFLKNIAMTKIDYNALYDMAMVSSNGDTKIAQVVASVVSKNGKDGHYIVEERNQDGITSEQIKGYVLDAGYSNQAFVNTKTGVEMINPVVLVKEYLTLSDIAPVASDAIKAGRPFICIGQCDEQALESLVQNHINGVGQFCNIAPNALGSKREDLTADLKKLAPHITKVHITRHMATFEYKSAPEIKNLIETIKADEKSVTGNEKAWCKERLARLESKIAKIYVGAETTSQMVELKDRLEDAILATIQGFDGYVPGAGQALEAFSPTKHKVWQVIRKAVNVKEVSVNVIEPVNLVLQTYKTAVEQAILIKRTHYAI